MRGCSKRHARGELESHENCSFLLRLVSILFDLAQDAVQFLLLGTRSSAAIKAENILLRKQLAPYLEREVKPRRATDATRLSMVFSLGSSHGRTFWSTSSLDLSQMASKKISLTLVSGPGIFDPPEELVSGKI